MSNPPHDDAAVRGMPAGSLAVRVAQARAEREQERERLRRERAARATAMDADTGTDTSAATETDEDAASETSLLGTAAATAGRSSHGSAATGFTIVSEASVSEATVSEATVSEASVSEASVSEATVSEATDADVANAATDMDLASGAAGADVEVELELEAGADAAAAVPDLVRPFVPHARAVKALGEARATLESLRAQLGQTQMDNEGLQASAEEAALEGVRLRAQLERAHEEAAGLRSALEEVRAENDGLRAQVQQAQDEAMNVRRRGERDRAEFGRAAKGDAIAGLIPIVDDLESAMAHVPRQLVGDAWVTGVLMIGASIQALLAREGVERINPQHEQFDPRRHEAVARLEVDATPEGMAHNTVVAVYRAGYALDGRVLRPAQVQVATQGSQPSAHGRQHDGADAALIAES